MLTDALIRGRQATRGVNGCLYTRLLSKTEELLKCVCEGPSKISSNFTLHPTKVGKMKRFKKVLSDLKIILNTDLPTLVADLWFLDFRERRNTSINLSYVAWENSLKLSSSKKESIVREALFDLK